GLGAIGRIRSIAVDGTRNNPGVIFQQNLVIDLELFEYSVPQIVYYNIGFFHQVIEDPASLFYGKVDYNAPLVSVQGHEINAFALVEMGRGPPGAVASFGRFHLDDIGA